MPHPYAAGERATPLLKERIRAISRHLPKALAGHEESVHQMRVAGRRLRIALPLVAKKPEGRRVRRALRVLRRLTRAAGGSRDLDVGLALFEERLREGGGVSPEAAILRRRLRGARARSRARMAEALLDLEIAGVRRDLRGILSRKAEGLFVVIARLRGAREREGGALLSELATLGDRYEPEALHRLRIGARRLRYTAEVNAAVKDQPSEAPTLFKELQERLGRIHDAHVLALWLGRQAAASAERGQAALAEEARRQETFFLESSRGHHRALLERGPAGLVNEAIAAMGPNRSAA